MYVSYSTVYWLHRDLRWTAESFPCCRSKKWESFYIIYGSLQFSGNVHICMYSQMNDLSIYFLVLVGTWHTCMGGRVLAECKGKRVVSYLEDQEQQKYQISTTENMLSKEIVVVNVCFCFVFLTFAFSFLCVKISCLLKTNIQNCLKCGHPGCSNKQINKYGAKILPHFMQELEFDFNGYVF